MMSRSKVPCGVAVTSTATLSVVKHRFLSWKHPAPLSFGPQQGLSSLPRCLELSVVHYTDFPFLVPSAGFYEVPSVPMRNEEHFRVFWFRRQTLKPCCPKV